MRDINFGQLSGRRLTLRIYAPLAFQCWHEGGLRFSWLRACDPRRWWRAIFTRSNWSLWWRYYPGYNHRCYCPVGAMFDGRIAMAGFGVTWFYSRFEGELPCPCDVVMDQFEEAAEAGEG